MKRIALLAWTLALLAPAAARAQDTYYTVHYCQAPGGLSAATDGLAAISGYAGLDYACPAPGLASGPPTAAFTTLQAFGIRYRVPADTRLARFQLWRTVTLPTQWNWTLFRDADAVGVENTVERCWNMAGACPGLGDGRISAASRVAGDAGDSGGMQL